MSTSKYTKKHFRDVAEILRVQEHRAAFTDQPNDSDFRAGALDALRNVTGEFADLFARTNPRFDRALFLAVVHGNKPVNARPSKKVDPNVLTAVEPPGGNYGLSNLRRHTYDKTR